MSQYSLPYDEIMDQLPKIYVNLDAIRLLIPPKGKFNITFTYLATEIIPVITLIDLEQHKFVNINHSLQITKKNHPEYVHIGYKHFDSFKNFDGTDMGLNPNKAQELIKRRFLGFFAYWYYRITN